MFDALEMAPPDPILGLAEAFKKDQTPGKINLSVGVYQDETGRTPIFSAVKKAEKKFLDQENSKNYLPISGSPEFAQAVQTMVFGAGSEVVTSKRAATVQTTGGTCALRVAGDFLKKIRPDARVWVSDPTWANHIGIFEAAGFRTAAYPYYDRANKRLDFTRMIEALKTIPEGDVVLLHASCHNPTGMDPTADQWKQISAVVGERKLLSLIDFAYQGFGDGMEEDAVGVRQLCVPGREALIASSFSKNFGLYNERVGALTILCASAASADKAMSHVKIAIRRNYSNPPAHGAAIVTTILNDPALRAEWEAELCAVRERIHEMRRLFGEMLKAKGVKRDFSFITRQKGMFSYSGLEKAHVETLRSKYAIYLVGDGRINVAGMTRANIERLCQAISEIL